MERCKADGCIKLARWRNGYCSRHAAQVRKHGAVTNTLPSYRESNAIAAHGDEAFIILLDKSGIEVGRAIIDADLIDQVSRYKWHLKTNGYVAAKGKAVATYLHRLVVSAPSGTVIDHIDGNPLNNRRSNLRICSQSENGANRSYSRNSSTRAKGVYLFKGGPRFYAQITFQGKKTHIGVFETIDAAKHAYNAKAKDLFGDFHRA